MELCHLHPEGQTLAGVRMFRWRLVLSDYRRIRENFETCPPLKENTRIQLLPINQHTLGTW